MREALKNQHVVPVLTWVVLALGLAACGPSTAAQQRALFRFHDAGRAVVLVSAPSEIRLAQPNPTLAGEAEVNVETTFVPIDLAMIGRDWAEPVARALNAFRRMPIASAAPAAPWVERLAADPRRAGSRGYRLLSPYKPTSPVAGVLEPMPPDEATLDDPDAVRCLLRGWVPTDNLPRPIWYGLDPREVAARFDAELLLLVSIEHVTVWREDRPRVEAQIGAYLVDLTEPMVAFEFATTANLSDADGPGGTAAAACGTLACLSADDWRPVHNALATLGPRCGYLLAAGLGWITPAQLAAQADRWRLENGE